MNKDYFDLLTREVQKMEGQVDREIITRFRKLIDGKKVAKSENPGDHFGIFFLPVNVLTGELFLIHHRKADSWIPPGGHMEAGEQPVETIKREYKEELGLDITREKIVLFDLSITDVSKNPRSRPCLTHFDMWYAVIGPKKEFKIDPGEFYAGGWFSLDEAIKKITRANYSQIVSKTKQLSR